MNRAHLLAPLFLALVPTPCLAQFAGGPRPTEWNVEIKMDDRSFDGVLALVSLDVEGDLGYYAIKPEKIKEVRFPDQGADPQIVGPGGMQVRGTIVTTSGEEISGTIHFPNHGIATDLGTLRPNPRRMRSLTFKGKKSE